MSRVRTKQQHVPSHVFQRQLAIRQAQQLHHVISVISVPALHRSVRCNIRLAKRSLLGCYRCRHCRHCLLWPLSSLLCDGRHSRRHHILSVSRYPSKVSYLIQNIFPSVLYERTEQNGTELQAKALFLLGRASSTAKHLSKNSAHVHPWKTHEGVCLFQDWSATMRKKGQSTLVLLVLSYKKKLFANVYPLCHCLHDGRKSAGPLTNFRRTCARAEPGYRPCSARSSHKIANPEAPAAKTVTRQMGSSVRNLHSSTPLFRLR